jgi:hypothetical protein
MKPLLMLFCLLFVFGSSVATAAVSPARLAFEPSAVVGSGFAAGRQVVLYGCANPPQPYFRRLLSYLNVVTADANGTFRWEAPEPISLNSVWFAIGSIPNDEAIAIPGTSAPPISTLTAPHLLVGRDAGDDALAINEDMDDVVIVRPNDTVWIGTAIRHGSSDVNRGLPGAMNFSTKTLNAKAALNRSGNSANAALNHLNPSDIVILINPISLRFYMGRLSIN